MPASREAGYQNYTVRRVVPFYAGARVFVFRRTPHPRMVSMYALPCLRISPRTSRLCKLSCAFFLST